MSVVVGGDVIVGYVVCGVDVSGGDDVVIVVGPYVAVVVVVGVECGDVGFVVTVVVLCGTVVVLAVDVVGFVVVVGVGIGIVVVCCL